MVGAFCSYNLVRLLESDVPGVCILKLGSTHGRISAIPIASLLSYIGEDPCTKNI